VLVVFGSNQTTYQVYKDFGIVITPTQILTGVKVEVKGYFDTDTIYLDYLEVDCGYGTSILPVVAGSQAYDSTLGTLTVFSGAAWLPLALASEVSAITGSNLGSGSNVFESKSGSTLQFRSLTEGDGISLTQSTTEIEIAVNSSALNPSGAIMQFAGSSAPTGWLICDGSAVNRTTYADLFATIGTAYGVGDGSTTFNLPDLKGKVPVGYNSGDTSFDSLGETGGAKTHTLSSAEMPSHLHTVNPPSTNTNTTGAHTHTLYRVAAFAGGAGTGLNDTTSGTGVTAMSSMGDHFHSVDIAQFNSGSTGSGSAHNNLQPYITLNYIIKT
jgi:microcystin-dependent protein